MNRKDEEKNRRTHKGEVLSEKSLESFSTGIEKILIKAAKDVNFKELFFRDRESVIESPEFSLKHHDKMLLSSIPRERLKDMIENFSQLGILKINPEENIPRDSPVRMARSVSFEPSKQGRTFTMGIRPGMLEKYSKDNPDGPHVTRGIRPDF